MLGLYGGAFDPPHRGHVELARRAGAAVVREAQGANNLNRALALAAAHTRAHGAGRMLVLPCDLPELTAESLHEFAGAAQPPRHMLLAPDAAGTGTNALLVDFAWGGEVCFGERSCARPGSSKRGSKQ